MSSSNDRPLDAAGRARYARLLAELGQADAAVRVNGNRPVVVELPTTRTACCPACARTPPEVTQRHNAAMSRWRTQQEAAIRASAAREVAAVRQRQARAGDLELRAAYRSWWVRIEQQWADEDADAM